MRLKRFVITVGVIAALVATVTAVVSLRPRGSAETAASTEAEVWTCSMHPQIRLPKPGRCPICGMTLIPVSRLEAEKTGVEQRAGLESETVTRRGFFKEVRTVGKLDYNERRVAYIAARAPGRVDRIYADFTGIVVHEGDHLVDIYSPELNVAQRELLLGLEAREREQKRPASEGRSSHIESSLLESARTKLRLLGILPEQIEEIERTKKPTTHLTIYAPIGGTVIKKDVRLGQYLKEGDPLYRIADLDPIWLYLNIYEYDQRWVRYGEQVDVTLEAYPGETFQGTVVFVDPFLDDATRTVRVRVNLKNEDRRLKPQMYANATIHVQIQPDGSPEPTGLEGKYICPMHPEVVRDEPGRCPLCQMPLERVPGTPRRGTEDQGRTDGQSEPRVQGADKRDGVLAVPVSAVLNTGRRQIAYRLTKDEAYELVELQLGPRVQAKDEDGRTRDFFAVLAGLNEGDRVAVQGGFLLDSQRQIEGMPSLLYPEGQSAPAQLHSGHGGGAMPSKPAPPTPGAVHQH